MLVGDVLATVVIVIFSALAAWAGGVLSALLFPARTEQASLDFEQHPWVSFLLGLVLMAVFGFVGAVLIGLQNPATSILGFVIYSLVLIVAVFGTGGLFRLVARRVRDHGGSDRDYQAIAKAGMLVVATQLLPFIGTFVLGPFILIASFGAGVRALVAFRAPQAAVEAPPVEVP